MLEEGQQTISGIAHSAAEVGFQQLAQDKGEDKRRCRQSCPSHEYIQEHHDERQDDGKQVALADERAEEHQNSDDRIEIVIQYSFPN